MPWFLHRLQQFGHQCLQRVTLQRQLDPEHLGQHRGVAGGGQQHLSGADVTPGGAHPGDPVAVNGETGDLAALDQVDAGLTRATGESPGHVVVLGDTASGLIGGAQDGVADVGRGVHDRAQPLDIIRPDPFGVDPVELVRLDSAHAVPHVLQSVREIQHAPLAEQDRIAQVFLQALPELQRMLVDRGALVPQVVGPDQGRVAGHVAAGQPPLLQHRDIGDAVVLGQVVRGGQAVTAAADDDNVIRALGFGVVPQEVRVVRQVGTWGARAAHQASFDRSG